LEPHPKLLTKRGTATQPGLCLWRLRTDSLRVSQVGFGT
jgi:hypothetical protein